MPPHHKNPECGVTTLQNRIEQLEETLNRQQSSGKSVVTPNKPEGTSDLFKSTLEESKRSRELAKKVETDRALKDLEDKFYQEINETFDISSINSKLVEVTMFAVKFVAENAARIGLIIGFSLSGVYRFDLALNLLKSIFVDVPVAVLENVIQHSYNIQYSKVQAEGKNAVHVLDIAEDHVTEIDYNNLTMKTKPESVNSGKKATKSSLKSFRLCHIV